MKHILNLFMNTILLDKKQQNCLLTQNSKQTILNLMKQEKSHLSVN